nr:LysE family translocator [Cohaesibacter celericrescens]
MISYETLGVFIATSIALGMAPGPDNIFVLTQSALYGRKAGFAVTLGLCTGLLVHTAAVVFGVAVLFQTSELAFTALKFIGAAYLIYLAYGAFRASRADLSVSERPNGAISLRQLYGRGIIMNITNPKVAIFFLAFLPQFADPALGPISLQMFAFGGVFIAVTLIVFGSVVIGAGYLGNWLRHSPKAQMIMNRIAGVIFVGLAARLATAQL